MVVCHQIEMVASRFACQFAGQVACLVAGQVQSSYKSQTIQGDGSRVPQPTCSWHPDAGQLGNQEMAQ